MSYSIDTSQLDALAKDLGGAERRVSTRVTRELKGRIGMKLKREMRQDASGHRQLRHLPNAVSYELIDPWMVECGLSPKKGTQGRLAHIIAYGSINNGPVYDKDAALWRSLPFALRVLGDAAEYSVLGDD